MPKAKPKARYDVAVVGSGAGGATAAFALVIVIGATLCGCAWAQTAVQPERLPQPGERPSAPEMQTHIADIDPQTLTLDPADVRRRITPRTRAMMVVHLWGHPAAMDELNTLAREHKLAVIEDASHAHGGIYRGRKVGTLGDIGVFSLQASKALPAGEGGLLVTNRREYFERALLLAQSPGRLHLHLQLEEHRRFRNTGFGGFKYRINPVNAVIVEP